MARQEAPQDALGRLIEALRVLPGVGPKSAQRMAFYLLQHDRNGAAVLAQSLGEAVETVGHCARCNTFSEPKSAQLVMMIAVIHLYCALWKHQLTK